MPNLYVATNGLSVWFSGDSGETLGRMPSSTGMYSGSQVWALATQPGSGTLYAGTDSGLYRLDGSGEKWDHVPSPMDDQLVTAIAFDPAHPDTIIAGTQPAALYRSDDAGRTWTPIETGITPYVTSGFYAGDGAATMTDAKAAPVKHWARVTAILFDPGAPNVVLAGVEIDGVWRSTDGGHTWDRNSTGLVTGDIHGFGIIHDATGTPSIIVTTCEGIHTSTDHGASWTLQPIDSPWQYVRSVAERADRSGVIFVTNGNGPPGTSGKLFRSRDYGKTWQTVALPVELESSLYFVTTHASDPNLIFVATNLGQILRSTDGGESWSVMPRRLPEVRALTWLPN